MTGDEFRDKRKTLGTLRDVAEQWGISKSTLHREEQKEEVRSLYADAVRRAVEDAETETTAS